MDSIFNNGIDYLSEMIQTSTKIIPSSIRIVPALAAAIGIIGIFGLCFAVSFVSDRVTVVGSPLETTKMLRF